MRLTLELANTPSFDMSRIEGLPGGNHQLVVNDEPFLMRACELNNSSLSSPRFMKTVWPRLVQNNVNTVLGAVTWDQTEPEEGKFDYEALDEAIRGARDHGLKLVLLWFGSFKNGMSTYMPTWVKSDPTRFPRAEVRDKSTGVRRVVETLSTFHDECSDADARAFSSLMKHLEDFDKRERTVIMVQVQNEVGLLGDSRDRSDAAQERFDSEVPVHVLQTLLSQKNTLNSAITTALQYFFQNAKSTAAAAATWKDAFGPESLVADEIFMAYHYSQYLEKIAAAGKRVYDLPLYTNVWLRNVPDKEDPAAHYPALLGGGSTPGEYPSGGGVETVLDMWQLFAPSLDLIAPDIYLSHYGKSCAQYRHRGQALFIPEQRRDEAGALRMWAAVGAHGALGVSPFGIDSTTPGESPFTDHYRLLAQITPQLLQARAEGRNVHGFFFDRFEPGSEDPSAAFEIRMGDWDLKIERAFVWGHPGPAYGLIIQLEQDNFLLVGEGFQVSFHSTNSKSAFSGIKAFREKETGVDGQGILTDGRWLNGDETMGGRGAIMPSAEPDYGGFFICSSIPARTRIAECKAYCF